MHGRRKRVKNRRIGGMSLKRMYRQFPSYDIKIIIILYLSWSWATC